MKTTINVQGHIVQYDFGKTSESYLKEINITENCKCADCDYFASTVTKFEFEIFQLLKNAGVDLNKNLESEPTGVWCVREHNGDLTFFQQVYLIKGTLLNSEINSFTYGKDEMGYSISATFLQETTEDLIVDIQVCKLTN